MNGYQVLEIFKANESLKAIPVVAVTANALARDIERGRAAGFTEYLIKPLDLGDFLKGTSINSPDFRPQRFALKRYKGGTKANK
jgi:CheY-like chemotaxis protein